MYDGSESLPAVLWCSVVWYKTDVCFVSCHFIQCSTHSSKNVIESIHLSCQIRVTKASDHLLQLRLGKTIYSFFCSVPQDRLSRKYLEDQPGYCYGVLEMWTDRIPRKLIAARKVKGREGDHWRGEGTFLVTLASERAYHFTSSSPSYQVL
jgi:hypothetical protein